MSRKSDPPENTASRWIELIWPIAVDKSSLDIGGRPTQISGLLAPWIAWTNVATRVL